MRKKLGIRKCPKCNSVNYGELTNDIFIPCNEEELSKANINNNPPCGHWLSWWECDDCGYKSEILDKIE